MADHLGAVQGDNALVHQHDEEFQVDVGEGDTMQQDSGIHDGVLVNNANQDEAGSNVAPAHTQDVAVDAGQGEAG